MEKIQHDLDDLLREMRGTNVRSHGLKVRVHESWCRRLQSACDRLREARLEPAATLPAVPPPPPSA